MPAFEYDAFQLRSIEAIQKEHSVLVSAPTGSGKTAIAEYAIEQALRQNGRVIYTAPIKAISNQKYREFSLVYPGKVGILTGDVSIEPDAPLLIMTTEIYRNQLFESPERHRNTQWVIFDEVHYLDDYERGTVWEESIMFSHPDTRFLCLSATAPNIQELADWIQSIHGHTMSVILETHRPVALQHRFQCQNEIFEDIPTLQKKGFRGLNFWSFKNQRSRYRRGNKWNPKTSWENQLRPKENKTGDLLKILIEENKMPCLYFAFGRKRVEELASSHQYLNLLSPEERASNHERANELMLKHDLMRESSAQNMLKLLEHGVGYHHAGLLPTLKEVVEVMFTEKRIKLIFTTETFALGINMPARTVIFDELRKFYGFGFDNLTTRDYFQMAGRAGRRGLDKEGYVYSRVNPQLISIETIRRIIFGQPEPIISQFNASYATLLNLYKRFGKALLEIYPKSLHYFQSNKKRHKRARLHIERKLELLTDMQYMNDTTTTPKGDFAMWMYGYELMLSELWEEEFLDTLSGVDLCVLLLALVYEPRKTESPPPMPIHFKNLERKAHEVFQKISWKEEQYKVFPKSKEPFFHLTHAMEAWMGGCQFHHLLHHTDIDEGIIIRYFRMVIQLLRQLRSDDKVSAKLKATIKETIPLINRDIVDAEKLLRAITQDSKPEPDETKKN